MLYCKLQSDIHRPHAVRTHVSLDCGVTCEPLLGMGSPSRCVTLMHACTFELFIINIKVRTRSLV